MTPDPDALARAIARVADNASRTGEDKDHSGRPFNALRDELREFASEMEYQKLRTESLKKHVESITIDYAIIREIKEAIVLMDKRIDQLTSRVQFLTNERNEAALLKNKVVCPRPCAKSDNCGHYGIHDKGQTCVAGSGSGCPPACVPFKFNNLPQPPAPSTENDISFHPIIVPGSIHVAQLNDPAPEGKIPVVVFHSPENDIMTETVAMRYSDWVIFSGRLRYAQKVMNGEIEPPASMRESIEQMVRDRKKEESHDQ